MKILITYVYIFNNNTTYIPISHNIYRDLNRLDSNKYKCLYAAGTQWMKNEDIIGTIL